VHSTLHALRRRSYRRRVRLRYLYVGCSDTGRALESWLALDGASLRWRFVHFGADVAAVAFDGEGAHPAVLLADHRPAGSVLPIYAVDDPDAVSERLCAHSWQVAGGPMGTPEGPATLLRDESGTEIALLRVERPTAMEDAYADAANDHAVRPRGVGETRPAARIDGANPHTGDS
jgi:predicted enzyme related to lactoylglutathione lyase